MLKNLDNFSLKNEGYHWVRLTKGKTQTVYLAYLTEVSPWDFRATHFTENGPEYSKEKSLHITLMRKAGIVSFNAANSLQKKYDLVEISEPVSCDFEGGLP